MAVSSKQTASLRSGCKDPAVWGLARLTGSVWFQVYVLKRPHVDEFLQRMGELFECVLFTASLSKVGRMSR